MEASLTKGDQYTNMKKSILRTLLTICLIASLLVGCSSEADPDTTQTVTSTDTATDAATGSTTDSSTSDSTDSNSSSSTTDSQAIDSADSSTSDSVATKEPALPTGEIVILYTNDTHTYINNTTTDADGNTVDGISFASVKALKDELTAEGKTVLLVDAGDHVQGTPLGGMDEGVKIINLMNKTGYDLAVPGNHEFDYGMFQTFSLIDKADFEYLSCNFYSTETGEVVFKPYKIFDVAGVKVAFVGISTPDSITSSSPTYFMDETRSKYLYNFFSGTDGKEMYDCFQAAVDEARKEADFVIGLGHLGVDPSSEPYRSTDLIPNITGIDAFIDGHSHTTVEGNYLKDASGKDVLLTQTGCFFSAIGQMTIGTDGQISTTLISDCDKRDSEVDELTKSLINGVDEELGEKIAVLENPLYIMDAENPEMRLVRRAETNLGDFVADATYYYFNEVAQEPIDIAINNGGGIRSNVEPGDISYASAKKVAPFGNIMCVIEATGQQILDCLEFGAALIGQVNPENGVPAEFGGFEHVAGLTYTINPGIELSLSVDDASIWTAGPSGEYRVSDVKVYNKETGEFEALDLTRTYRIGGINYTLRNQGDGMAMFNDCKCVVDFVSQDYVVLAEYMKAFAEVDGVPTINSANSPLVAYAGYPLDYENPLGSGRIQIIE